MLQEAKTPWKAIFTSVPVWAVVVAHCGQNWGFWMIITEISIYMSAVLKFDLAEVRRETPRICRNEREDRLIALITTRRIRKKRSTIFLSHTLPVA